MPNAKRDSQRPGTHWDVSRPRRRIARNNAGRTVGIPGRSGLEDYPAVLTWVVR